MTEIILYVIMLLCGLFLHFYKKWDEKHCDGTCDQDLIEWLKSRPYKTVASLVAAIAASTALYEANQLTAIVALTVGYMADSAMDYIKARSGL